MQTTAENLNAQQLLQAHITQLHWRAKMLQHSKLAWFIGGLEHRHIQPKGIGEAIHKSPIQNTFVVERPHTTRTLACLDNQLHSASIEPGLSSINRFLQALFSEGSFVLFAHLILHSHASIMNHL